MNDQYANERQASFTQSEREQTYLTREAQGQETAKVLALGGVAAGVASGLIVLLTERETKQKTPATKVEQARIAIEEAAGKAVKQGKKAESGISTSLLGLGADTRKKGRKGGKTAQKRGARFSKQTQKDMDETMAKLAGLLATARNEAAGTYANVEKRAPDVNKLAHQLRTRTDVAVTDAKKTGTKLAVQVQKDAIRARGDLGTLVDTLKTKAVEAEKVAESYVGSTVLPKLRDLEKEAVVALETGKVKTQEVRKHAEQDLLPQAKVSAEKFRHTLEDQAKVARQSLGKGPAEAAVKLGSAAGNVEGQVKGAGEAVKRGGRETRSLLLWVGLGGALVYNVFLNEDQQKKVRELGTELFGEVKDMYTDMKGENGSFSS